MNISFLNLFKQALGLIKKEPILITPITIYLFCIEFFSAFSPQKELTVTIGFMAMTLFVSTFLKGVLFLSTAQVITLGEIDLDALLVSLKSKRVGLTLVALIITIPSLWFNQTVSLPLLYGSEQVSPILIFKSIGFLFFSLYSVFLLLFMIYESLPLGEVVTRSFRFVLTHFLEILKHVVLCIGVLFIILFGFSFFFIIPKVGPLFAMLILGSITTIFFVYVSVFFHHIRHSSIVLK